MPTLAATRFPSLDRLAIGLSGLCALHCIATAVMIGLLSSVAGLLEAPIIHEGGLVIAMALGAIALGQGARQHGLMLPIAIGGLGLGVMAGALSLPHGWSGETAYTVLGVALLAFGHELNRRAFW
ncbi:MerC domain-containing protein [Sphingobium nicotianae]|uniref:MerC family mercury resistance protein n=1 Tax=Sphingobium nicotianae TaxID=2782607 RepID=A0A9X1DF00_9SPHN|nr:MerC domain-containing protein [Sphingobium nicotianae]MBT2188720.1 MerC family mercury resistance protein [Sphingobium nicotianae]